MIGFAPQILHYQDTLRATHELARQGQWALVFNQIKARQELAYSVDSDPRCSGWTLFDHAIYQKNIPAFQGMAKIMGRALAPQAMVVLAHVANDDWTYIRELLKQKIIQINAPYIDEQGCYVTLLDMVVDKKWVADGLQSVFGALSYEEMMIRATHLAAREKSWQVVFQLLDQKPDIVDCVDRGQIQQKVLLQHACDQGRNDVILKLIRKYQADIEVLLCAADQSDYRFVLDAYYEELSSSEEALEQEMASLTLDSFAKPITPGYSVSFAIVTDAGIHRLREDYDSQNDTAITYRGKLIV